MEMEKEVQFVHLRLKAVEGGKQKAVVKKRKRRKKREKLERRVGNLERTVRKIHTILQKGIQLNGITTNGGYLKL